MKTVIEDYIKWISENLDEVESLKRQCAELSEIYKKRVFEDKWPKSIQEIIDGLKSEIKKELTQCQYYLKRIEEIRNGQISKSQPLSNETDVGIEGTEAGDSNNDFAGVE